MRDAFFDELAKLFTVNPDAVFITGDLGYKLFDKLNEIAPDRVINFGIREGGMAGFAAGLAKGGMLPFIYSITPFVTLRCLEQIKIDICYNRSRVVIVGVGGGMSYGANGPTHHGADDIGVLSCLPGITIWTPSDPVEVRACVLAAPRLSGPAYLRLGRNGEPVIAECDPGNLDIEKPIIIDNNGDGCIITNGFILGEVLKAAALLKKKNISPKIIQLTTFRPFPEKFIEEIIQTGKPVMTVEEHVPSGGLGLETAGIIARLGRPVPFRMLSLPRAFPDSCLDREAALSWAGIDAESIAGKFESLAR